MNAKEMFEELEYKEVKNLYHPNIITYTCEKVEIDFYLKDKDFNISMDMGTYLGTYPINMKLYKAINQQLIELCWL